MSRGGIWWFLVLCGALATAAAIRYIINGRVSYERPTELAVYALLAVLGLAGMVFGLVQVVRKSRAADLKEDQTDDELRIT